VIAIAEASAGVVELAFTAQYNTCNNTTCRFDVIVFRFSDPKISKPG
jgi:hypothetical protein